MNQAPQTSTNADASELLAAIKEAIGGLELLKLEQLLQKSPALTEDSLLLLEKHTYSCQGEYGKAQVLKVLWKYGLPVNLKPIEQNNDILTLFMLITVWDSADKECKNYDLFELASLCYSMLDKHTVVSTIPLLNSFCKYAYPKLGKPQSLLSAERVLSVTKFGVKLADIEDFISFSRLDYSGKFYTMNPEKLSAISTIIPAEICNGSNITRGFCCELLKLGPLDPRCINFLLQGTIYPSAISFLLVAYAKKEEQHFSSIVPLTYTLFDNTINIIYNPVNGRGYIINYTVTTEELIRTFSYNVQDVILKQYEATCQALFK